MIQVYDEGMRRQAHQPRSEESAMSSSPQLQLPILPLENGNHLTRDNYYIEDGPELVVEVTASSASPKSVPNAITNCCKLLSCRGRIVT